MATAEAATTEKAPAAGLSIAAFARMVGCSPKAIKNGIARGRLARSVGLDALGRHVIVDQALARREWLENAAKTRTNGTATTLSEAQRQVALERARSIRVQTEQRAGKLIAVAQANREAFEASRTIRENVLGVVPRIAAELAAETDAMKVHARLEAELRQALQASATVLRAR
jgi:hypothetical protein